MNSEPTQGDAESVVSECLHVPCVCGGVNGDPGCPVCIHECPDAHEDYWEWATKTELNNGQADGS